MKAHRSLAHMLAVIVLTLSATFASAQVIEWNHNPASDIGPNFFGSLTFPFATCGSRFDPVLAQPFPEVVEVGKKQSPIDIVTANTVAAHLPSLGFHYRSVPFVMENTGHVVEVPYEPGSVMLVGQDTYELLQFHFHAPGEHAVNGQLAAAELHLVHRNSLLDIAVVGVQIKVGAPVNAVIDKILLNAPLAEGAITVPGRFINAKDVLPQFVSYYNYSGSLTTPPCSEGVRWFVLKEPVFVSQAAINRLHKIISKFPAYDRFPDNNRPVRPLNGRVVLDRIGR